MMAYDGFAIIKVSDWDDDPIYYTETYVLQVSRDMAVPEPSVIALFGIELIGIGFARRRQS
jgi:hypothetical protein